MEALKTNTKAGPPFVLNGSAVLLLVLGQAILILMCEAFSFFIPLGFLALILLWLPWHNMFLSLNGLILLHIFIVESTEGVSAQEVIVGFVLFYIIGVWFFTRVMMEDERILETGGDRALVLFVGCCMLSIVPGLLYGVSLQKWARELIPLLSYLILFPLRQVLRSRREIRIVVVTLFVLCLMAVFRNILRYRSSMAAVEMMWQIASSRTASNEPFFFMSLILAASILLFSKSWKVKVLMAWLVGVFALALIITFSRGYWVATALGLSILFLLVPGRIKVRILVFGGAVILFSGLIITFFFGEFGELILESVLGRFVTLGSFLDDPSFRSRITESVKVLSLIRQNPVWGYGLGMEYDFVSAIPREMPTAYVHNAYLYLIFKTGILGTLAFFIFFFSGIKEGMRRIREESDLFVKAVRLGIMSSLLAMIPLSITSPQFVQKDSILLISVGLAILLGGHRSSKANVHGSGSE